MKIFFLLINLSYAQQLRKLVTACDQLNPPSCVNLLFSVNGRTQIHSCSTLESLDQDFITEHTFMCSIMRAEYISTYCLNLTNMPDDCFRNIGNKINTLYRKHVDMCSNINTIFNMTNSTITTYCSINWIGNWWESTILLMLVIGLSCGGLCMVYCCVKCICIDIQRCIRIKQTLHVRTPEY
jgi:hypothetical protein